MSLCSDFGRGKTALWWKITALDFSGWLEGSQPSAESLGCRVSPVLVELSCLCLRRWRCRKATVFAARTNMMPGRKMISGGKMNTHASTQRRWTRRCLCGKGLTVHRCVLHEKRLFAQLVQKICWTVQAWFISLSSAKCRSWNSPKLPINSRPCPSGPLTFMAEM